MTDLIETREHYLIRKLNEANAHIALYRDALEKMMLASCEMSNCGVCSYAKKVLDSSPPSALLDKVKRYEQALEFVAYHGTSRPPAMGEGDEGDGWHERICREMISRCANTLKDLEKK